MAQPRRCTTKGCRKRIPPKASACPACGGTSWSYVTRYRDPAGREVTKHHARAVDAKRDRDTAQADLARGDWIDPRLGSVTLADYWARERLRPGIRGFPEPTTLSKWDSTWRRYVGPALGNKSLASITRSDVRHLVAGIESPWQGAEALKLVRMLLGRAVDAELVRSNVAARLPVPRTSRVRPRILTPAEVEALVASLPERWRAFVALGAFSSLRWSELVAVKRDDLDLHGRTVRVDEKITEVDGRFHWGRPKTEGSSRVVDLPDEVVGTLAAHMLRFPPVLEAVDPRCTGLVFHGQTNEPVRRKTFRRVWLRALADAGITEHVRVEWLRHSGGSIAYLATKDLLAVAKRLGHTSTRMAEGVYVDLYREQTRHVADAIDELLRASRGHFGAASSDGLRDPLGDPLPDGNGGGPRS